MALTLMTPQEIGARVRYFREKKGLNLATAAGLAGIDKSYLSRLENGKRGLNSFHRRELLEALAVAVGCSSVAALIDPDAGPAGQQPSGTPNPAQSGQPAPLVARSDPAAAAVILEIRTALLHCTLDDVPDVPTRPIRELVAAARLATERLYEAGRDDLAGQGLADLMIELQVTAATATNRADKLAALAALVEACMVAEDAAFTFGDRLLAVLAAERGQEAADRLGNPALIGFAVFTRARALSLVGATTAASHSRRHRNPWYRGARFRGDQPDVDGRNDAWRRIDEYTKQLGMSDTDALLRVAVADRNSQSIRVAKRCLQQYPPSWFNNRYGKCSALRMADDGSGCVYDQFDGLGRARHIGAPRHR